MKSVPKAIKRGLKFGGQSQPLLNQISTIFFFLLFPNFLYSCYMLLSVSIICKGMEENDERSTKPGTFIISTTARVWIKSRSPTTPGAPTPHNERQPAGNHESAFVSRD